MDKLFEIFYFASFVAGGFGEVGLAVVLWRTAATGQRGECSGACVAASGVCGWNRGGGGCGAGSGGRGTGTRVCRVGHAGARYPARRGGEIVGLWDCLGLTDGAFTWSADSS